MNSIIILLGALFLYFLAYRFYARFIGRRVLAISDAGRTPAHEREDGIDFVPAPRLMLFGHHFASIAGLGPIMGPAIAVIWGWLPAVLWVVFGAILFGAVHDFSTLVVSVRHQGRSIGDLTSDIIGPRARMLFLFIIFFLLGLAMGVFAFIIATLFTSLSPESVIPTFSLILIAVVFGWGLRNGRVKLLPGTVMAILLMLLVVWLGTLLPVPGVSAATWIWILLGYAFIASILPVWLLLQPRDYINSFMLFIGIAVMVLGVLVTARPVYAPAVNTVASDLPPIFPLLFITIACGAISGFHNLVSSGTTARQLDRESHSMVIGYGAMLAESLLAILVILACTATIGGRTEWFAHYSSWKASSGLQPQLGAFITGAGTFAAGVGLPRIIGETFIAVMVVTFAMTTLDSGTRLLRYNIEELSKTFRLPGIGNRYAASALAVLVIGWFALMKVDGQPAGLVLWQLFGTSNQMLAGLGLLTVTIYLVKLGRPTIYTLVPMLFMMVVTVIAMVMQISSFAAGGHLAPLVVGLILMVISAWLVVEAAVAWLTFRKTRGTTVP